MILGERGDCGGEWGPRPTPTVCKSSLGDLDDGQSRVLGEVEGGELARMEAGDQNTQHNAVTFADVGYGGDLERGWGGEEIYIWG